MNGEWRRDVIRRVGRAVFLFAATLGCMARADAAAINVSWTAPTTNANGTPLTDLSGYRVYLATTTPTCPGGGSHAVSSSTSRPPAGQTVSSRVTGLTASTTYFVRITAVDTSGNESACSAVASGTAHSDITVTPTATVSFGSIAAGATTDRTFTVQNTSTSALTGTASVAAPYTIVSGGSFSLSAGASQAVVVRFRPTAAGTFTGNVNFTGNGDTTSRAVSGTATGSSPSPPDSTGALSVFITQPAGGATVGGSGTAVVWVEGTSGSANTFTLSVDGATKASQTSPARGPVTLAWTSVPNGTHTLTATVRDATGQTGSTKLTVSVTGSSAPPASPPPPPPSTRSLSVFITQPADDAIVGGAGTAVVWVEGTSGSANMFTLSVDGVATGSQTTSTRGPVTLPWTSIPNGAHTLTATVRDASGETGRASLTIRVTGSSATAPPAPPPSAPSAGDTLDVAITQPTGGAVVGGTAWVVLWVSGVSGSSNTFTLEVDGDTVGSETTAETGPVSIPWTTAGADGAHTLTAVVRDASGNTGRASVEVTVRN
jgi:hypothetical protein